MKKDKMPPMRHGESNLWCRRGLVLGRILDNTAVIINFIFFSFVNVDYHYVNVDYYLHNYYYYYCYRNNEILSYHFIVLPLFFLFLIIILFIISLTVWNVRLFVSLLLLLSSLSLLLCVIIAFLSSWITPFINPITVSPSLLRPISFPGRRNSQPSLLPSIPGSAKGKVLLSLKSRVSEPRTRLGRYGGSLK